MGDFLVVYLASIVFYTAVVGLGRAFEVLAAVAPAYEQVEPMLSVLPSGESTVPTQVELSGEVHLDRVTFRYSERARSSWTTFPLTPRRIHRHRR